MDVVYGHIERSAGLEPCLGNYVAEATSAAGSKTDQGWGAFGFMREAHKTPGPMRF
jgi:hypothetical protein